MYRIGHPFWKILARSGVPLKLRINVLHDKEAGVFVATSDDLPGLVVEAETIDALVVEAKSATLELLNEELHQEFTKPPVTDLRLCQA